jgi:hypothetical protein
MRAARTQVPRRNADRSQTHLYRNADIADFRPRPPAGAGRVIAREHRAQHASRIPREGVLFREPPDMAGGPVFSAQSASLKPQSLG